MSSSGLQNRDGMDKLQFHFEKLVLPAGEARPLPTTKHHVCMHVGGAVATRRSLDGHTQQRMQLFGDIDVVPEGMAGIWRNEDAVELLLIEIEPEFVAHIGDDHAVPATLLPMLQIRDPYLQHLSFLLAAEYRGVTRTGRVYAESLMTALLARLIALQERKEPGEEDRRDRLSALQ